MKRRSFPDSRVDIESFGDQDAFSCDDAEVWMEGDAILVSYFDDEGIVVLEGILEQGSSYRLMARSRPRSATLSPVSDRAGSESGPAQYAGLLSEQGETASWTLTLGAEESDQSDRFVTGHDGEAM